MIGQGRTWPDRNQLPPIPFSAVNRPGRPGHVAGLQRHHLIPRAIARQAAFAALLASLGRAAGLDDFRRNGLLLPASEAGAVRMGLPLHRGPHRHYSAMARERLGTIEGRWTLERATLPLFALENARAAVKALQDDLRLALLSERAPVRLNRRDPRSPRDDYAVLDAMADALWGATQREYGAVLAESAAIAA